MSKIRKINQRKAGALLSYATMGIEYIVAFIYTPILISILGQNEYGNYNYVMSVTNYLMIFSSGFGTAYVRFYSRYKEDPSKSEKDIRSLNGMFMSIFLAMGVLVLVLGMTASCFTDTIFGGSLSEEELSKAPVLVRILVVNIFVTFINIVFKSFVITQEKFIFQKLLVLLQTVLRPAIILPILYMGQKSVGVAVGTLLVSTIIMLIDCYYCTVRCGMRFSFRKFDFSLIREIAVFCSFLLILLVVERLNWSVDKMILGKMIGTAAVAIYTVAAELIHIYKQLSVNMASVFVAKVNKMIAGSTSSVQVSDLFVRIGRILFLILGLICSGFIFFGRTFIALWVGPGFEDSYYIALLLMIPATIPEIQKIGPEILKAKNMHKFRSIAYLLIAICNVLISIPLCRLYGGIGCAIGTAVTVLVGNGLVINIYYHKKAQIDVIRFWKQILSQCKGFIIPALFGTILSVFVPIRSWILLFVFCFVYALIYAVSHWLITMNAYEKGLIVKVFKKLH